MCTSLYLLYTICINVNNWSSVMHCQADHLLNCDLNVMHFYEVQTIVSVSPVKKFILCDRILYSFVWICVVHGRIKWKEKIP